MRHQLALRWTWHPGAGPATTAWTRKADMTDESLQVLIVDDHPVCREGLAGILADANQLTVVGQAADGQEAIRLAAELQPDIVLMDLNLPEVNGIDATREIVAASPHIGVVVLTMFDADDSVFAAMRAGARGYLLKGAGREEIIRAVRAAGSGEAIFGAKVATRMIEYFAAVVAPTDSLVFPELTQREREVLSLIAAGRSNTENFTFPLGQLGDRKSTRLN